MTDMPAGYVVVYNILPEVAAKMETVLSEAVRKAAFMIQIQASVTAPHVTGFLATSIYVETLKESTYGQGVQAPSGDAYLLPEVERPAKATEAIVAVGANYGAYVEFGTSHMGAQPYLSPAVEAVRPQFIHALEKLEAKLAESAVKE